MFRKKKVEHAPLSEAEKREMKRKKAEAFERARLAKEEFDEAFHAILPFGDLTKFLEGKK